MVVPGIVAVQEVIPKNFTRGCTFRVFRTVLGWVLFSW